MDLYETTTNTNNQQCLYVNPQKTWVSDDYTWINPNHITPLDGYQLYPAPTDTLNYDAETRLLLPDTNTYPATQCPLPAPIPFWAWTVLNNLKTTVKPTSRGPLFQAYYSGQVIGAATTGHSSGPDWNLLNQYQDDILRLARPLEGTRLAPYEALWAAGFLIWSQTRK